MSMELHVFSDRQLGSAAEWQRAIDLEKYALSLDTDIQLSTVKGFVPATFSGKRTGFECFHDNAKETMIFLGKDQFDHNWVYAFGLRWRGSDLDELQAAWMAATAYAAASKGILYDHEEGKVLTLQQSRDQVAEFVRERPKIEARLAEMIERLGKTGSL